MKALITGARGTVGSVLCQRIEETGGTAIAWDRAIAAPGDTAAARALVERHAPDAIFHLALPSQPTGIENEGYLVNEKWTADMAALAAERGIPFVYASTVMVFTNDNPGPLTPDVEPDETEGYGYFKLTGERTARRANPDARIARLGWQIGRARGSNNMIDFLEKQFEEHGVIDASTRWMPGTSFLEDTADSLIAVAGMAPGTYHIGGNHEWSFYDIVSALNEIHGNRWTVKPNEDFVCDQRLLDDRLETGRLEGRLPLVQV